MRSPRRIAGLALAASLLFALAATAAPPGPVLVELRERATATGRTVTVGDVAELRGGAEALRERIAGLDLAELPPGPRPLTVKRAQVEYRLRLADVPLTLFRLTGADAVAVAPAPPAITEERVVAAAREALLRRLPWAADEVQVRQIQPVAAKLPAGDAGEVRYAAEPHTSGTLTGRVQMDVAVLVGGQRAITVPVYLEVKPLQTVAVCRRRIERGAVLTDADVHVERRAVEPTSAALAAGAAAVGQRVKRPLVPGQVIAASDLEGAPAEGPAVRARQPVRLVVRLGAINVVATGEALQDGRIGQTVRVQNVDSKKVVAGRVSAPGTVEVEPGGAP